MFDFLNSEISITLAVGIVFVWVYAVPAILAAFFGPRIEDLPEGVKSLLRLFLPTLEAFTARVWDMVDYVIEKRVEITVDTNDDEWWDAIDERVRQYIDRINTEGPPAPFPNDETTVG